MANGDYAEYHDNQQLSRVSLQTARFPGLSVQVTSTFGSSTVSTAVCDPGPKSVVVLYAASG